MLEKWCMRTTRLCRDINRYKVIGVSNLQQIIIIMYVETKQLVVDKWWNSCTFFFIHEILVHSFRSYHWVRIYTHKTNPDSLSKTINGPIRYSKVQFVTLFSWLKALSAAAPHLTSLFSLCNCLILCMSDGTSLSWWARNSFRSLIYAATCMHRGYMYMYGSTCTRTVYHYPAQDKTTKPYTVRQFTAVPLPHVLLSAPQLQTGDESAKWK